jgi:glutamyl-tRNA synthetase
MKDFLKKAKAYALKNAISYNGKANQGAVISGLFNEGLKREEIKEMLPKISDVVKEVNSLSLEEQKKEFKTLEDEVGHRPEREGLPELPLAEKGVTMRIAPSPSGPLHLMHAINLSLNYLYVEKYGGKIYIRIEDTNPENIYEKAYKMIQEEARWLTDNKGIIMIQSNRMNLYYKYAEKLIKKEAAYICTCSPKEFKKYVEKKRNCPCRKKTIKENQKDWKKMFKEFKEGEAVLRFKTPGVGMKHKNPAMRDFPLARINETEHPKQKKKYRVWPLMNLAVSVDDIETKMTHIIRGKDHRDNAERQKMIYKVLGKKYPWYAFTGMTNFVGMKFSTRQMREDIESGKYSGWDDPKLPTVASLKKRGYKPIAFRKFAEETENLSEVDKTIKKDDFFELLDRFNEEGKE